MVSLGQDAGFLKIIMSELSQNLPWSNFFIESFVISNKEGAFFELKGEINPHFFLCFVKVFPL